MNSSLLTIVPIIANDIGNLERLLEWEKGASAFGIPRPANPDRTRQWFERVLHEHAVETARVFAVRLPWLGLIGTTRIGCISSDRSSAQISYWIGFPYRGHGYATVAAQLTLAFALEKIGVASIRTYVYKDNEASRKVISRLGFRFSGIRNNIKSNRTSTLIQKKEALCYTFLASSKPNKWLSSKWDLEKTAS